VSGMTSSSVYHQRQYTMVALSRLSADYLGNSQMGAMAAKNGIPFGRVIWFRAPFSYSSVEGMGCYLPHGQHLQVSSGP
jgi:hypothetical protein